MLRVMVLGVVLVSGVAAAEDKLHIDVPHHHSKADARARAQMLFDYWHERYGVQASWSGDVAYVAGRVMGVDINAMLVVSDATIGGDANDPGPILRGVARSYITRKLQKYMDPQYREP